MGDKNNSEAIRILMALIAANLENANNFDFDKQGYDFTAYKSPETDAYTAGFKEGARVFLGKLKAQLGGYE